MKIATHSLVIIVVSLFTLFYQIFSFIHLFYLFIKHQYILAYEHILHYQICISIIQQYKVKAYQADGGDQYLPPSFPP